MFTATGAEPGPGAGTSGAPRPSDGNCIGAVAPRIRSGGTAGAAGGCGAGLVTGAAVSVGALRFRTRPTTPERAIIPRARSDARAAATADRRAHAWSRRVPSAFAPSGE